MTKLFTASLKHLALAFAAAAAINAGAVVYTPGSGSSDRTPTLTDMPGVNTTPLFKENVRINGVDGTVEVYKLSGTLEYITAHLHKRFPNARLVKGDGFLRIAPKVPGTPGERWLLLSANKELPVTAFRLYIPGKLQPPVWPGVLPPPPPEAKVELVVAMPRRNAVIATFYDCAGAPHTNLARCAGQLRGQNYQPVGAEHSPKIRGRGDLYIRMKPAPEVIVVSFGEGGAGLYYHRKLN